MANLSNINGKFVVEQTTGYVGVGTTDPNYPIEVLNASAEIALNASGGSIYRVQSDSASNFIIRKEGVGDRLVINSAGNSTFAGNVTTNGYLTLTGQATPQIFMSSNTAGTPNWTFIARNDGYFLLGRSGVSNDFYFDPSGNATFGGSITIPDYIYHAGDGDTYIGFPAANEFKLVAGGNNIIAGDVNSAYLYYQGGVKLATTNTGISVTGSVKVIDSFSYVNLESSTGTNQVQVKVLNTGGSAFFGRDNSAGSWFSTGEAYATTLRSDGAYPMIFRVNGGNRLTIDSSGNSTFSGNVTVGTSAGANINLIRASANYITASNASGALVFRTGGYDTALTLNSSQNATFAGDLTVTGSITGGSGGSFLPLSGGTMTGNVIFNNSVRELKWNHTSGQSGSRAYGFIGEQGAYGRFALRSSNAADNVLDTDVLVFNNDLSATFAGNQVTVDPASGDAILQLQSSTQTLRIDQNSIRTGTNNNLALFTNGNSNQLVLKQSNGNVGIGISSPAAKLHVQASNAQMLIGYSGNSQNFFDADNHYFRNSAFVNILQLGGDTILGTPNNTQRLKITTDYSQIGPLTYKYPYYRVDSFRSDGSGYFWAFGSEKSDGTQSIGMMLNDGVSGNKYTRIINTLQIASFTSNEYNGAYPSFQTNIVLRNSGNSYLNGGNVGIGITGPAVKLHVVDTTTLVGAFVSNNTTRTELAIDNTSTNNVRLGLKATPSGAIIDSTNHYGSNVQPLIFQLNAVEKMRITSGGDVLFGTQGTPNGTSVYGSAFIEASVERMILLMASDTTSTSTLQTYYNPNGAVGSIKTNGSATSFNTSSDYRLKEDLQDFAGLDMVSKIPVYDFKWKTDESRSYGVMAHELQEVLPDAVSGDKDAEEMQGVDYSKIVPLLVKSIQELKADNDSLKARIETLENN